MITTRYIMIVYALTNLNIYNEANNVYILMKYVYMDLILANYILYMINTNHAKASEWKVPLLKSPVSRLGVHLNSIACVCRRLFFGMYINNTNKFYKNMRHLKRICYNSNKILEKVIRFTSNKNEMHMVIKIGVGFVCIRWVVKVNSGPFY